MIIILSILLFITAGISLLALAMAAHTYKTADELRKAVTELTNVMNEYIDHHEKVESKNVFKLFREPTDKQKFN